MSFLTAASERSSSGSGVSGASDASFSGASSFSFSFCAALALLAIRPLLETPGRGTSITNPPLPYAGGIERPHGSAGPCLRPCKPPDSGQRSVIGADYSPIKPPLQQNAKGLVPVPRVPATPWLSIVPAVTGTVLAGPRRLQNPRSAPRFHRATPALPSHPATRNSWPRSGPVPGPVQRP